ncbi:MAG: oligosaccharide flippase family protein [Chloroflexota bacterium]
MASLPWQWSCSALQIFFSDLGMRAAVIHTKDNIERVSFFAFIIVNVTSLIIYLIVFIFAEPITVLLGGDASLVPILRLLGLIVILDGLWLVPQALMARDLKFKQLAWVKFVPDVTSTTVALLLAYLGFGVYSLVFGQLTSQVLAVVISWAMVKDRTWLKPQPWDKEIVSGLFRYGLPTTGAGLSRFFSEHWDDWFVGRTLGATQLGYYSRAYDVTSRLTFMFGNMLFGNIMQPTYSKLQDDPQRLERGYVKSTGLVMLSMVPIAFGLAVLGPQMVLVLFGEKWLPMATVWQVFSLYALTRPISANSSPLFLGVGKPQLNLHAVILIIIVMVPLVLLLIGPMGIVGVALAVSLAHVAGMFFNLFQVNRILPGTAVKTFRASLPILVAGVIMALGVQLAKTPIINLANGENIVSLILLIVIGALIYVSVMFLLQRDQITELSGLALDATGLRPRISGYLERRKKDTTGTPLQ